jgi:hypothetical protein
VLLALAVALTYTLVTSQAWEDYYIAFRHSVHLVEGNGLTYQPGQRIQGFSSPLATLLLAATYAAGGSEPAALWLFRGLSMTAYAAGLWFLLQAMRRRGLTLLVLPGLLYVLDAKAVAFSVNGMETGLWLLLLAGSLYGLSAVPERGPWVLGACWAGLLWTRPDSVVYLAAMVLASLAFTTERRRTARRLLQAGALCAAGYLPWVLFAWWYYGSPIPQSVVAKGLGASSAGLGSWMAGLGRLPSVLAYLYLPPYSEFSSWRLLAVAGGLLAAAASLYWAWPAGNTFGRMASLMTLCGALYLALLPRVYPWYYPAVMLCSLPAVAALASHIPARVRRTGVVLAAVLLSSGLGWAWLDCARTVRVVQQVSENGNRVAIGRWLAANAAPGERVYLECPGYIGYHSGLEMLDYPGLVSPTVVAARRAVTDDFAVVGQSLAPEWMVLRSEEVQHFRAASGDWIRQRYRLVRTFDVAASLREQAPGHPGILYDGTFHVLRRRDGASDLGEPAPQR